MIGLVAVTGAGRLAAKRLAAPKAVTRLGSLTD